MTVRGYGSLDTERWYGEDRKSTRLNSSHVAISYAVFCVKKKMYCYFIHTVGVFHPSVPARYLHSFPTRRSSDLGCREAQVRKQSPRHCGHLPAEHQCGPPSRLVAWCRSR